MISSQNAALEVFGVAAVILGLLEGSPAIVTQKPLDAAFVPPVFDDVLTAALAAQENFDDHDTSVPQQYRISHYLIDKAVIRRIVAEQNAKSGFVPDLTATPQRAQALVKASLLAQDINPEDNIFSQGIIDARDEK